MISGLTDQDLTAKSIPGIQHKSVSYDDRVIKASGKYDPEEYYYNNEAYLSDEFEADEEVATTESSAVEATKDPLELTSIVDNYKHFLQNDSSQVETEKDIEFQKEQEKLNEQLQLVEDIPIHETARIQLSNSKLQMKKLYGPLYEELYSIYKEGSLGGMEDKDIHKKARKLIPKQNKKALAKLFELEMIVFKDLMKGE